MRGYLRKTLFILIFLSLIVVFSFGDTPDTTITEITRDSFSSTQCYEEQVCDNICVKVEQINTSVCNLVDTENICRTEQIRSCAAYETQCRPNGRKVCNAIMSATINYFNGTEYTPIIKDIVASSEPGYSYEVKKGVFQTYFKDPASEASAVKYVYNGVVFTYTPNSVNYRNDDDEREVLYGVSSAHATPTSNVMLYDNAFGNIDLKYTYANEQLKEDIVIPARGTIGNPSTNNKNPTLDVDFVLMFNASSFEINGTNWDRTTTLETSGDVYVKDAGGNTLFVLTAPSAYDSSGASVQCKYQFRKILGNTYVIIKTPFAWLNSTTRQYPVTIDPTTSLVVTGSNVMDAVVKSNSPADILNYNGDGASINYMYVSQNYSTFNGTNRFWVNFKLSGFSPEIEVINATVNLYRTGYYGSSDWNETIYKSTNITWRESNITWITQPVLGTAQTNTTINITLTSAYIQWIVPNAVNASIKAGEQNITFVILNANEMAASQVGSKYTPREGSDDPFLNITYSYNNNISQCSILNLSGVSYILNQSILNSDNQECIKITGSNVVFDCNNNEIEGNSTGTGIMWGSGDAISIYGNNVMIKNCNLDRWNYEAIYSVGDNTTVNNTKITNSYQRAIYFTGKNTILYNITSINTSLEQTSLPAYEHIYTSGNNTQITLCSITGWMENCITEDAGSLSGLISVDQCFMRDTEDVATSGVVATGRLRINNSKIEAFAYHGAQAIQYNIENSEILNNSMADLLFERGEGYCGDTFTNINLTGKKGIAYFNKPTSTAMNISGWNNNFSLMVLCDADSMAFWNMTLIADANFVADNSGIGNNGLFVTGGTGANSGTTNRMTRIYGNTFQDVYYVYYVGVNVRYNEFYNNSVKNAYKFLLSSVATSGKENKFYNNLFNVTTAFTIIATNKFNSSLETAQPFYGSGPKRGGNYWADPTGTGHSETCSDSDFDGICDTSFTLSNGGSTEIDYLPLTFTDVSAPTYSNWGNNATSATTKNTTMKWNITLTDTSGLSATIFAHNMSGTLSNQTAITQSGTVKNIEFNLTINITKNNVICGQFWFNDSGANANQTNLSCFTVANALPSTPNIIRPVNNTNYTTLQFNYSSVDIIDGDAVSFRLYINDSLNQSSASNITGWTASDGVYSLKVSANDSTSSSANSSVIYFTLDTTGPSFSGGASNSSAFNGSIQLNITLYDGLTSVSGYIVSYNKTQGALVNQSFAFVNAPSQLVYINLSEINLTVGKVMAWQVWANDSLGNINVSQLYTITILNYNPLSSAALTFRNSTAGHRFNVTATFSDKDGASDFVNKSIQTSSGACDYATNITAGNDISIVYNCSGTALTSTTIMINTSDTSAAKANSSFAINVYPNALPVVASATINDSNPSTTDDIMCLNGSVSDADGDSVTLYYEWLKSEVAQSINYPVLGAGNLTTGDIWKCQITPYDSYQNGSTKTSASVSVDTSFTAPSINFTNATTNGINPSTLTVPTNNNSYVNLSVTFYDPNTEDVHSVFFCKSNGATTTGCTGDTWCNSTMNTSFSPYYYSCRINISALSSSSYGYYVFVADNSSLISASTTNTFYVNHYSNTPTIYSPTGNITTNYTYVNFSSSDTDGDYINYTIYNSTDGTNWDLLNINSTQFYWADISDGTHFLKAYTTDQHGYSNLINSSSYSFTVDTIFPVISNQYVSTSSPTTSDTVTFSVNISDANGIAANKCNIALRKADYNSGNNFNITTSSKSGDILSVSAAMATYSTGTLEWKETHCQDDAGNKVLNSSVGISITISAPVTPTGGGSSSTGPGVEEIQAAVEQAVTSATICGNGVCQEGENPWNCAIDCPVNVDELLCAFTQTDKECPAWVFSWLIYGILGMTLFVLYRKQTKGKPKFGGW